MKVYKNSTTKVVGIHWETKREKYRVSFKVNDKTKHFGRFDNLENAEKKLNKVKEELRFYY